MKVRKLTKKKAKSAVLNKIQNSKLDIFRLCKRTRFEAPYIVEVVLTFFKEQIASEWRRASYARTSRSLSFERTWAVSPRRFVSPSHSLLRRVASVVKYLRFKSIKINGSFTLPITPITRSSLDKIEPWTSVNPPVQINYAHVLDPKTEKGTINYVHRMKCYTKLLSTAGAEASERVQTEWKSIILKTIRIL